MNGHDLIKNIAQNPAKWNFGIEPDIRTSMILDIENLNVNGSIHRMEKGQAFQFLNG